MALVKRATLAIVTILIALFTGIKAEARQTYVSDEIVAICDKYGSEYDIDIYFLIAIVECESSGNPSSVSANGQYIGLMQLNKDTFYGDLFDADNNINQGARYIFNLRNSHENNSINAYSYFCGESGRWGGYTRKVINRYFELYCEGVLGKEEKKI